MYLLTATLLALGTPVVSAALILVWFGRHREETGDGTHARGACVNCSPRPNTRVVVSPSGVGLTRRIGPARVSTSGRGAVRIGRRVTGVFRWR